MKAFSRFFLKLSNILIYADHSLNAIILREFILFNCTSSPKAHHLDFFGFWADPERPHGEDFSSLEPIDTSAAKLSF